jgi:hypothetical protein
MPRGRPKKKQSTDLSTDLELDLDLQLLNAFTNKIKKEKIESHNKPLHDGKYNFGDENYGMLYDIQLLYDVTKKADDFDIEPLIRLIHRNPKFPENMNITNRNMELETYTIMQNGKLVDKKINSVMTILYDNYISVLKNILNIFEQFCQTSDLKNKWKTVQQYKNGLFEARYRHMTIELSNSSIIANAKSTLQSQLIESRPVLYKECLVVWDKMDTDIDNIFKKHLTDLIKLNKADKELVELSVELHKEFMISAFQRYMAKTAVNILEKQFSSPE